MFRTIVMILFLSSLVLLSLLLIPLMALVGLFSKHARHNMASYFLKQFMKTALAIAGTEIIILGQEHLLEDQAVLYVANHRSYFDIVLTYILLPRKSAYISKIEVNKVPLLRVWVRYIDCLYLDRSSLKQGLTMILSAIDQVRSGISMFIFPEGTRSRVEGEILPFHEGSFKIASKSKCPVVPITMINTADIYENHHPTRIKKTKVAIIFDKPFWIDELPEEHRRTPGEYAREIIEGNYQKYRHLVFGE